MKKITMNKSFYILNLILGLLVSVSLFTACGSDDDDDDNGGGGSSSSKRVKMLVEEDNGYHAESTFSYDSKGRVVKVVKTETSSDGTEVSETTYQYGQMMITSQEVTNGWDSKNETHTYTLSNGLITKDVEVQKYPTNTNTSTMIFSYDSDGYLLSQTNDYGYEVTKKDYVWSNGNMVSFDSREFEYSNYSWSKGMFIYFKGTNTDRYLQPYGYWGKMPKNLPSKDVYKGWSYDYVVSNGQVEKMTITNDKTGEVSYVATFTWE
jgi:hypothetical protein